MEFLGLEHNYFSDIDILEIVEFPKITHIHLQENYISDIDVLEKIDFNKYDKLKELNLACNSINLEKYSSLINNLKTKFNLILDLQLET